ncbi:MAG TPA: NTP transferase domain-containing protein [Candidatus Moranbacteria bacterium]|nr:NTP transferase domain-containing protein [Candidatus Moranbacteria bacterium]
MANQAIILMAGRSSRLKSVMKDPKSLMPLGEKKLIDIQLDYLFRLGVKKIILILGYKKRRIISYLQKKYPDKKFIFIYNKKWNKASNLVSLLEAKSFLKKESLIINCDVLFPFELIKKISSLRPQGAILAVQKKSCGNEEMKFMLDEKKKRMVMLTKKMPCQKADGEFMGISYISKNFGSALVEIFSHIPYKMFKDNFYEWGFQIVSQFTKLPLQAMEATHLPIIEIDFPKDYDQAKKITLPKVNALNKINGCF